MLQCLLLANRINPNTSLWPIRLYNEVNWLWLPCRILLCSVDGCFHTTMATLDYGATETVWCSKTEIFAVWLFFFLIAGKQAPSCCIWSSRYHLSPVTGQHEHLTSIASRLCHLHGSQQAKLCDFVTAQCTWVSSRLPLAICTQSQWTLAGVGWDRVTGPPRHGGCWPCNYLLEGKCI